MKVKNMKDDFFDSHYALHGKKVMCYFGQWPHQRPFERISKFVCFIIFFMVVYLPQLTALYRFSIVQYNRRRLIKAMTSSVYFIAILVKATMPVLKTQQIKILCDSINENWENVKNQEELSKLHQCSELGKKFWKIYLAYMFIGCHLFTLLPIGVPVTLDFFFSGNANSSRNKLYILDGEYLFIDKNRFYTGIYISEIISSWIFWITIATVDFIYVVSIHHCVAMLTILKHRLRLAVNFESRIVGEIDMNNIYDKLVDSIKLHKKIIHFAGIMVEMFSFFFLIIDIFSLLGISIGANCILSHSDIPQEFFRFSIIYIGGFIQIFYVSLQGQILAETSASIVDELYQLRWYKCPVKVQKLILFYMMRAKTPISVNAAGLHTMNLEHFGRILKTGISYIAVVSSMSSIIQSD